MMKYNHGAATTIEWGALIYPWVGAEDEVSEGGDGGVETSVDLWF
jgi:hypothetical protein